MSITMSDMDEYISILSLLLSVLFQEYIQNWTECFKYIVSGAATFIVGKEITVKSHWKQS